MYYTGESLLDGNFPSVAWTEQHGLYTEWDWLLRELISIVLFEKKQQLGMLNPYAEAHIPKKLRCDKLKTENDKILQNQ